MRAAVLTRGLLGLVIMLSMIAASGAATSARAAELLMFEMRGCPWCEKWHAEVGRGYPHSVEGRRAPLRIVDVKARLPEGLVLDKPVSASPTFVLIDGQREIGRITGYPGADFFWGMLQELLAKLDAPPATVTPPGQRSL